MTQVQTGLSLEIVEVYLSSQATPSPVERYHSPQSPVHLHLRWRAQGVESSQPVKLSWSSRHWGDREIDLPPLSQDGEGRTSHSITTPEEVGEHCLEICLQIGSQVEKSLVMIEVGDLGHFLEGYFQKNPHRHLALYSRLPRWKQRHAQATAGPLDEGERIIAVLDRKGYGKGAVFTSRRAVYRGRVIPYSKITSHWGERGGHLVTELSQEWDRPFVRWNMSTTEVQYVQKVWDFLLSFPLSWRPLPPSNLRLSLLSSRDAQAIVDQSRKVTKWIGVSFLAGAVILTLAAFDQTVFLHHTLEIAFLAFLFICLPFIDFVRQLPPAKPLDECSDDLLGPYTKEDLKAILADAQAKLKIRETPRLYIAENPTAYGWSTNSLYFNWIGRLNAIYLSSHLLHSLERDELSGVIARELAQFESYVNFLEQNYFVLRFSLVLYFLYLATIFPTIPWVFFTIVAHYFVESHLGYFGGKMYRARALLASLDAARAYSSIGLINACIKGGVRAEICARTDWLAQKVIPHLSPAIKGKQAREFAREVYRELPDGFIHLEDAHQVFRRCAEKYLPSSVPPERIELYLKPLDLNWRDFDSNVVDDRLDEVELGDFLEALCTHPTRLFPTLYRDPRTPQFEETILFVAANSKEITFPRG